MRSRGAKSNRNGAFFHPGDQLQASLMHWELNSEVRWLTGRPETKREVRLGEGEREGDKKGEGREERWEG